MIVLGLTDHVIRGALLLSTMCEFLGVEIPETPFPHVNKTNQFLAGRMRRWWRTFGLMVAKVSVPAQQ